jgi:DNA replication and repair protein RecF
MKLESLQLTNFRSYPELKVTLSPDVTLIVGPNASGKTNLLESLYVLASTKSFRARDRDLIHHGSDYYRIAAKTNDIEYAIGLRVLPSLEKRVTHNGVKRPLIHHIGKLQATLFEPTDLELISGSPESRLYPFADQSQLSYDPSLLPAGIASAKRSARGFCD